MAAMEVPLGETWETSNDRSRCSTPCRPPKQGTSTFFRCLTAGTTTPRHSTLHEFANTFGQTESCLAGQELRRTFGPDTQRLLASGCAEVGNKSEENDAQAPEQKSRDRKDLLLHELLLRKSLGRADPGFSSQAQHFNLHSTRGGQQTTLHSTRHSGLMSMPLTPSSMHLLRLSSNLFWSAGARDWSSALTAPAIAVNSFPLAPRAKPR